ncbi:MAG: NCS2 family permease [Candidatus Hydrogenedentes bacterium]|nr:NCS2 family permease [Candidatus Hydrogenedentota bacterium]
MNKLNRFFEIEENASTVRREVIGGLTTFATMSYIVFVQPTIMSIAGMPFGSALLATCLASAVGCFLMGFIARYPFALAPGMGANFFFAFAVCGTMGFSWQAGLAMVFIAGLLFLFLSLFGARERLMDILPECLKNSIGPAIGMFIAFIGFQWSGIIVLDSATMVRLSDLHSGPPLITIAGVLLIVVLMAREVRSAILIGIVFSLGANFAAGVLEWPEAVPGLSGETFFSLAFSELGERWDDALVAIALFFFLDLFDTIGTLVGVGKQAGYIPEGGTLPRASRAFFSDAAATCAGALFGTSTVTTYIESSTGVAAGARTGLAAVTTGLCFLAAPILFPLVRLAGQNVGPEYYEALGIENALVSMYPAVAPAMIVVGMLMLSPLRHVAWQDVTEALPAFLTIMMMVFGYGITEGVAMGCISFAVVKTLSGRAKEVNPIMYLIAIALVARYAFLK